MFTKTLIATCFAALAAAQSSVLTFTYVPNPITDGQANAITYSTNDTASGVTITLRKGASTDLKTVSVLTTDATGGQFVWTPATSLADGTDYALEITQGTQVNYYGPFTIQGANPSAVASASSASASSTSANSTTVAPATTAVGTVGSSGAATGTALPRNTTMSSATLTGSATATSAGSTTGAGFQGTASASASSSTVSNDAASLHLGSALSLVLGAAVAAFYL